MVWWAITEWSSSRHRPFSNFHNSRPCNKDAWLVTPVTGVTHRRGVERPWAGSRPPVISGMPSIPPWRLDSDIPVADAR